MFQIIFRLVDKIIPSDVVFAHCDIPCGIYDPNDALQAAKTMLKMTQKLLALDENSDPNNFTRMVMVKEKHGKKCKHELLTLWTDYFKPEHLEKLPDLHEKVWTAAKQVSKVKQHIDEAEAKKLVLMIEEIGKMFASVEGAPKKE